eukprot:CAMPEP_0177651132 /NCGR_PEP_ID=MMETSP0447-20121125/12355_1 /TAXON_ID=0 /ORGANISM="Stygamoeba regulata, Strain BSH-02190019" /LENGTH=85 /DNA_ID=CAMNT_0019154133 /DNA_START=8 /DNA_END=261 /DNA_ORIENTATION=+
MATSPLLGSSWTLKFIRAIRRGVVGPEGSNSPDMVAMVISLERGKEVVSSCPSSIRCMAPFLVFSYFLLLKADPQQLRPSSDPSG